MTWKSFELVVDHETGGTLRGRFAGDAAGVRLLRFCLDEHDIWGRMYRITAYDFAGNRTELHGAAFAAVRGS